MENEIVIYKANSGIEIQVKMVNDTIWLDAPAIASLFHVNRPAIVKHIQNIYKSNELVEISTCSILEQVALDGKKRKMNFYNLDMIISIGYRVNSKEATQFRQWATQRLKDYLVQGYAINEKRLAEKQMQVQTLKTGIRILGTAMAQQAIKDKNQTLQLYASGLAILDDYDHEQLDTKGKTLTEAILPDTKEYIDIVQNLQSKFQSAVFAKPKDQSFESAIAQIGQSFDGKSLYPSVEEKAATLLYLIVKNHCFVDGNKRIGAACFLHFLEINKVLFLENNELIISNDALAALTLFVAASKADEMETVKKLIISILNRK